MQQARDVNAEQRLEWRAAVGNATVSTNKGRSSSKSSVAKEACSTKDAITLDPLDIRTYVLTAP